MVSRTYVSSACLITIYPCCLYMICIYVFTHSLNLVYKTISVACSQTDIPQHSLSNGKRWLDRFLISKQTEVGSQVFLVCRQSVFPVQFGRFAAVSFYCMFNKNLSANTRTRTLTHYSSHTILHTHTHTHTHIYIYIYIYIYTHMHTYLHTYPHTPTPGHGCGMAPLSRRVPPHREDAAQPCCARAATGVFICVCWCAPGFAVQTRRHKFAILQIRQGV